MKPIRVLELRSVRGTGGGPEKTILRGTARTDPRRFAITVCYIRDLRDPIFEIDKKAGALPIEYVELRERHSYDPSIWPALRRLVADRNIDIVHAHDYKTNFLAAMLRRFTGVQAMSTVHGWDGTSWRERCIYYPADRRVLRLLPRVIAVSEPVRQTLLRSGLRSSAVRMVANGIDAAMFRRDRTREPAARQALELRANDFVVGTVGRLTSAKRYDLLISAIEEVGHAHPNVRLLIAGDGPLREFLAGHIRTISAGDHCRLLGDRADVIDLHHAFDLFVQSSETEGTSNALLEAMALETPIIATDVGGTRQLIRDGVDGVLVPPCSVSALATAITDVIRRREPSREWTRQARRRTETDLSFETRMGKVEEIYTELMAHSPGRPSRLPLTA